MRALHTLLVLAILAIAACSPAATSCEARFADDRETAMEASGGTSCERAARNLRKVCPSRVLQIEDLANVSYETWCQYQIDHGTPLCPTKLARVKACKEIDDVCR